MNIEDMTIAQARAIAALFSGNAAAPNGEVIVGRGAITDAWPIAKAPRVTK